MKVTASTALVSGASGGIGYELAGLFARNNHNLVLVARNSDKLTRAADDLKQQFGVSAKAIALDLAIPEAPQSLFGRLQRDGITIDILVNNAGYGVLGPFAEIPVESSLDQIQLNITALTNLTRLFLGPMLQRGSGKILNVASTAGFQPGPVDGGVLRHQGVCDFIFGSAGQRIGRQGNHRYMPLPRTHNHRLRQSSRK